MLDVHLLEHVGLALLMAALLCLALFLRPFDGTPGNYSTAAQRYVQGKEVWVPCNFRAHDEGDRFLLPGAHVHGYDENWGLTPTALAQRYRLFTLQVPLTGAACDGCRVIGERLEIRGRQSTAELKAMLAGDVLRHLFVKELLVESSVADPATPVVEGCR